MPIEGVTCPKCGKRGKLKHQNEGKYIREHWVVEHSIVHQPCSLFPIYNACAFDSNPFGENQKENE